MSAAGRIVNDVKDLQDDGRRLGEDAADAAQDGIASRTADIERLLRRVEDTVSDLYDTVAERGAQGVETVEETITENPWLSMLAAFAAGALLTHLLSRR
ncbi:MAG TPA: hypothetical protein VGF56_12585 [Rhizomicrobium sp.]|jgi:ElaB/YqjD/DUF883 family membrane-anchored ribosome-binding protein